MACQILLDFSPRSTLTLGDSCSPEAPMGRTQTGAVRRRRWTPRARTGCLTCRYVEHFSLFLFFSPPLVPGTLGCIPSLVTRKQRTIAAQLAPLHVSASRSFPFNDDSCSNRRVKCDEDRPVCRRCISSRLTCRGYQVASSSSSSSSPSAQSKPQRSAADTTGRRTLQTPPATPPHRSESSLSVQQQHINIETEPPDWDFQQGIRYCTSTEHSATHVGLFLTNTLCFKNGRF